MILTASLLRGGDVGMNIRLIDFDSKIPNLALMKISAYFKDYYKGSCDVGFDVQEPDRIYVSVIFTKNKQQAAGLTSMYPQSKVEFGGSGWSLESHLPPDVEFIKPDYDLYPSTYSQGFTTRGCIRKCQFCIVPEKEGQIATWQHPSVFHDDRFDTCMIMDNNLFAAPDTWQKDVFSWFSDSGVKMLSPQGWDARLLTEERTHLLKSVRHPKGLRFAWDNMQDEPAVIRAINLLKAAGFNLKHDISFYVLVGFNTTFEQDLYRCNKLREWGVNAFVMQYHKKDPQLRKLAKWANRRWAYWSAPFVIKG